MGASPARAGLMIAPMCIASTAPAKATPSAPPSERKQKAVAVAQPNSLRATPFWIAVGRLGITGPIPRPITTSTASIGGAPMPPA
jgi:hypothetical protein